MRSSPVLQLAPAILAATVGIACRPAPASEPTQPVATPKPDNASPQPAPLPDVEQLRDECLRTFLPGMDLSTVDLAQLEAEVDKESEESVQRFEQLEALLADARELCEERAVVKRETAVCVQRVAPEHAAGCELYSRTNELPEEVRAAPTAVVEIAELVRAYWMVERVHPDWSGKHGCPTAGSWSGDTGFVPPLYADCGASQSGQCVAAEDPKQPWEFGKELLGPGTAWHELGFWPSEGRLRFHYRFEWRNEPSADGCIFQVEVRPAATREDESTAFTMVYAIDENGLSGMERFEPGVSLSLDEL